MNIYFNKFKILFHLFDLNKLLFQTIIELFLYDLFQLPNLMHFANRYDGLITNAHYRTKSWLDLFLKK
jgi:hypothetical protein